MGGAGSAVSLAYRRILLVGYMGAGKSTVGRILAARLGWAFRDFDRAIEERVAASISEIFEMYGEEVFRGLETRVGTELLAMDEVVLASGGGWPSRPGRLEGLPSGTLSVWLRIDPEEALRRVRADGEDRPLLQGPEAQARIHEHMTGREPQYRRALWWVDAGAGSPEEVAERILRKFETDPGRPLREGI
jgi:shikimate kinase